MKTKIIIVLSALLVVLSILYVDLYFKRSNLEPNHPADEDIELIVDAAKDVSKLIKHLKIPYDKDKVYQYDEFKRFLYIHNRIDKETTYIKGETYSISVKFFLVNELAHEVEDYLYRIHNSENYTWRITVENIEYYIEILEKILEKSQ